MRESKIIQLIVILPIIGVLLTSFILTNIFISSIKEKHNIEIEKLRHTHLDNLKNTIEERIEHLSTMLENSYQRQLENSKQDIKNLVHLGFTMIENTYEQHPNLSREQLFKLIDENMHSIRFFDNKSGYYFIYDLTDAISISLPSAPNLVGTSLKNLKDVKGKNLFQSYQQILQSQDEGFDHWYWNKPNEQRELEKIGYIKKFKPLNIVIGTAIYIEDIKKNITQNALSGIKKLKFSDQSYIFVIDTKGTALYHKQQEIVDIPLEKLDQKIQKNVQEILQKALQSEGTFLEYTQSKQLFKEHEPSKKISYVKYIPKLDWVIGTGLYTNELNNEIAQRSEILKNTLKSDIKTIIGIALLVSLCIIIILIILSKKLNSRFNYYAYELEQSNNKLQAVNLQLEHKVQKQVAKIREKDLILNQQSKLSAMGEMIGHISHQWRQPLSAISTLASGILVQKEIGALSEKQLETDLNNIVNSTQTLSHTIDDFRNFYSNKKKMTQFMLNEALDKTITLVEANLKNHNIQLIKDESSILCITYKNELIQVLLNIINNAKDALKEQPLPRYIFITTKQKNNDIFICIYDNAGGIDSSIIKKVFEPYFTTKQETQGTGIGLYMSKSIIKKSLKGSLKVQNKSFEFKNKKYQGAEFIISFPLLQK